MGFFLTDWINSAMAAPGSSSAKNQNSRNAQVSKYGLDLMKSLFPTVQNQLQQGFQLEPQRQQATLSMINGLQPGKMAMADQKQKNAIDFNSAQASRRAELMGRGSGMGSGYASGQNYNFQKDAMLAKNQIDAASMDPMEQAKRIAAWLEAIQQGQTPAGLGLMNNLASQVYGQPQVQVQPGFGQILGSMASAYMKSQGGG